MFVNITEDTKYKNRKVVSDTVIFKSGKFEFEIRTDIFECSKCGNLAVHVDNGNGIYECTRCTMVK